jgi:hypothetical protein
MRKKGVVDRVNKGENGSRVLNSLLRDWLGFYKYLDIIRYLLDIIRYLLV